LTCINGRDHAPDHTLAAEPRHDRRGALSVVAAVSLVIGVLVVVLVSLALVGLSARESDEPGEPADVALVIARTGSGLSRAVGTVIAVVCLLGAAAIVLYGLYLLA
jgi:ferric-dicitrate binding protein FerR (iron transport regulator)